VEGSTGPVASVLLFRAYCGMASCKSTRELLQNKNIYKKRVNIDRRR